MGGTWSLRGPSSQWGCSSPSWDREQQLEGLNYCPCFCREELLLLKEESDTKVRGLEGRCEELQEVFQKVSEDHQKVGFENTCSVTDDGH